MYCLIAFSLFSSTKSVKPFLIAALPYSINFVVWTFFFISIARSVYKYNDKRASIKYEINTMYNSLLCEIKDY